MAEKPYPRPCNDYGNGCCTEKGRAEPGFCICKAQADEREALLKCAEALAKLAAEVHAAFPLSPPPPQYLAMVQWCREAKSALLLLSQAQNCKADNSDSTVPLTVDRTALPLREGGR
jgi:hypothetical protein